MDKKISGYRMLRSRKEYSGKEDAETDGFAADEYCRPGWVKPELKEFKEQREK